MSIVVIVNANARRVRRRPAEVERMREILGDRGQVALTRSPSELDAVAQRCASEGVQCVALTGGDGTNHVTMTRFTRALGTRALPRFALLGGGTMNIVAASLGVPSRPPDALQRLLHDLDAGTPSTARRRLLRIQADEHDSVGFIFGNGLLVNFLREYYLEVDPTPVDSVRLLARAIASVLTRGAFAQRLFSPVDGEITADGHAWCSGRFNGVMASTQEHLGFNFRPFVRARERSDGFHAVAMDGTLGDVLAALPAIRAGRALPRSGFEQGVVSSIEIRSARPGPWMLDGDIYPDTERLTVSTGPMVELLVPVGDASPS